MLMCVTSGVGGTDMARVRRAWRGGAQGDTGTPSAPCSGCNWGRGAYAIWDFVMFLPVTGALSSAFSGAPFGAGSCGVGAGAQRVASGGTP